MACESVLFSSYALDCLDFLDLIASLDQSGVENWILLICNSIKSFKYEDGH